MKKIFLFALLLPLSGFSQSKKWIDLFNGKDLNDWKMSDNTQTFSVQDGLLMVEGPRNHLFYNGPVANHDFKDFELEAEIMTYPGANSGVYVCTEFLPNDWPKAGYEIQVNNSHTDWRRSASLYNIVDVAELNVKDNQWYKMNITVKGNRIVTKLNGVTVVDYTQPETPNRNEGNKLRVIKNGTIAIQGHDPKSKIAYKSIKVRLL
ncbi:DUF1080 domain-containing protein [Sandaracinomonas limnophila]|uniref:DUF1080 domain-containing protein n=1 Tax=Sandaracinomonas limnophila TaxID=1862386 RepID=A0A437PTP5_9BACT|nr:DUF1080 domain-containing protein [Sandaracinomonas limnophila]RVU25626.1 DUF1080 domain-containing protein [Sandaracinomonas limnophila]